MKNLYLIFNHTLTDEQKDDAKKSFGIDNFISLPDDLQQLWSNVPPEIDDLKNYLAPLLSYLKEHIKKGDFILVQGDFGATYIVVNMLKELGATPIYATTKREAIEKKSDDGIKKISIFKHVRYREYE